LSVVFTCERHAAQGARAYLDKSAAMPANMDLEIITLPCVGSAPPDLLTRTLDAGASEVRMVGCPADDCTNREGNSWAEQRLVRERVPRLKRPYANAPITAYWLPPDDFSQAVEAKMPAPLDNGDGEIVDYLGQRHMFKEVSWRNYFVAFFLLALVMALQVLLTDLPVSLYAHRPAVAQAIFADLAEPIGRNSYISSTLGPELALTLTIDDEAVFSESYQTADLLGAESTPFYFEHELAPGEYHLRLDLADQKSKTTFVLFDENVPLEEGRIFRFGP
jgi:hypothetical protein